VRPSEGRLMRRVYPPLAVGLRDFGRVWGVWIFGWPLMRFRLQRGECPPVRWVYLRRRSPWWAWPWISTEGPFLYVFNFVWRLRGQPR